ncbi:MAG: LLM class F420-dependent oxidoreductase [Myxococcota bacterium]
MKIDVALLTQDLAEAGAEARRIEELGYDGAFSFEGPHDPFFPLLLAAEHTEKLELQTAIAVAFARNPMLLANIGYDLQKFSKGRFTLGLGSQIRPHIEKRFSQPWSKPAERMRELVLAIRAIWRCWHEGEKLDFRGEFYNHTLMTPFFNPGPNPYGPPRIFVAGVGPRMTEAAAEVGDGFFVHPFHTAEFLRKATLPLLERGVARSGRSLEDLEISCPVMVATGSNEEELEAARNAIKTQIAFYASTPAYRVVLDHHGWGELQPELNRLSKQGRWPEMAGLVDDRILEAIAVCGEPAEIAGAVRARCEGIADRVSLVAPYAADAARWAEIARSLRSAERKK